MSKTPLLTFRCPQDLIDSISKQVEATGETKTDVAIARLRNSVPSLLLSQRNKLPSVPAIYFVITEYNSLLYIGRAKNLYNRWCSHHRYQQFMETDKSCRIAWFEFEEENQDSLPTIEDELITLLYTEYNNSEIVNGRFKATIDIDSDTWKEFKLWAKRKGSNASEQVKQFIYSCLDGYQDSSSASTETILLDGKQQDEYLKIAQQQIEQSIAELKATLIEYIDERINSLPKSLAHIDDTDGTEEKERLLQTIYSDQEVADQEGKTRQTINRYRTGRTRNPDRSFYDRWEAIAGEKAWHKKN